MGHILGGGWAKRNLKDMNIIWIPNSKQVFKMMNGNRFDLFLNNRYVTLYTLKQLGLNDNIVEIPNILATNPINPHKIKIIEEIADIDLDVNMAIPCGLIINELVSNSLKHAFPDSSEGKVTIKFDKIDDYFIFTVRDDGIGIPDDSQIRSDSSFGLLLVNSLIKQLHGILTIVKKEGIEYTIKFKYFSIKTYQQINSKI